jgi:hypothetical protein
LNHEAKKITKHRATPRVALRVLRGFVVILLFSSFAHAGGHVKGVALAHTTRGNRGYGSDDCRAELKKIADLGGTWVSISDFAFMQSVTQPSVRHGRSSEADGLRQVIADAHALNLKVLVKPHLWSRDFGGPNAKWHGDIVMKSDADWDEWFRQYGDYILSQAKLAGDAKAEAFCVGVEYGGTVAQETRWRKLIADVRGVYGGKITYAASFAEWKTVPWWDAVDCIGIDAYFPVATSQKASDDELRLGWAKVYAELEPFVRASGKQVCFTELGYSASADAGKQPWAYGVVDEDPEYQARLYKIALDEASKRDWVVGAFVWKWFTSDISGGRRRDPFAMQDREPVLKVLKDAWSENRGLRVPPERSGGTPKPR